MIFLTLSNWFYLHTILIQINSIKMLIVHLYFIRIFNAELIVVVFIKKRLRNDRFMKSIVSHVNLEKLSTCSRIEFFNIVIILKNIMIKIQMSHKKISNSFTFIEQSVRLFLWYPNEYVRMHNFNSKGKSVLIRIQNDHNVLFVYNRKFK